MPININEEAVRQIIGVSNGDGTFTMKFESVELGDEPKISKRAEILHEAEHCIYEALRDLADKLAETGKQIEETLKPLLENPPEDIPRLKKQIKHCKNPLEEKALRKRLNEATRNSRRRKKIGSR
jgi:hypothetical protein